MPSKEGRVIDKNNREINSDRAFHEPILGADDRLPPDLRKRVMERTKSLRKKRGVVKTVRHALANALRGR